MIESFKEESVFKSESIMESRPPRSMSRSVSMDMASEESNARSPNFRQRQRRNYEYRSDIGDALRRMGSDFRNVVKYDFTALQLATWLTLFIDRDRAGRITVDEAEAIGRAVTAGLLNQDSLTKDDVSALAKGTVDELQRIREERAVMRQQMDQYRDQAAQEREVMQRKLDEYHDQAAQLEIQIRQMKEEAEMIDEALERKRRELKS